jgi:hypothetical protein
MTENASFIPPNITPPDPPEAKVVALVFSIFMLVILIAFIGVVSIEFLADMAGYPLIVGTQQPLQDAFLLEEKESTEEPKNLRELMTPRHQTQMRGPEIVVIYTRRLPDESAVSPELLIDGTRHPWEEQYGGNTWFARLQLPAGLYHLQVEESEAEFFVETLDSSLRSLDSWVRHRPHPDADKVDRCSDCHEMVAQPTAPFSSRNKAIGAWKGVASCFDCHDAEKHNIIHAIVQPMADQCLRCHVMH